MEAEVEEMFEALDACVLHTCMIFMTWIEEPMRVIYKGVTPYNLVTKLG